MNWLRTAAAIAAIGAFTGTASAGFGFVTNDYYSTSGSTITQYTQAGAVVGTLSVPTSVASDLRGIAFGSDGLLYAAAADSTGHLEVISLDATGKVHETYAAPASYVGGNISYGKIAFDSSGHFYVGSGDGLYQFTVGEPNSATMIFADPNYGVFDVKSLPDGNLVIADSYDIYEITTEGALVHQFQPKGISLVDVRGLAYDPLSKDLFVTMLGYTGEDFQLMKFNYATGKLLLQTTFTYGDNVFLTRQNHLLVASRTQDPGIFTKALAETGTLKGGATLFVTQK